MSINQERVTRGDTPASIHAWGKILHVPLKEFSLITYMFCFENNFLFLSSMAGIVISLYCPLIIYVFRIVILFMFWMRRLVQLHTCSALRLYLFLPSVAVVLNTDFPLLSVHHFWFQCCHVVYVLNELPESTVMIFVRICESTRLHSQLSDELGLLS